MNKEITWNIVNSLLAGALVFLGALTDGQITLEGTMVALVAAGAVAITQFKRYWINQENQYCKKTLGSFVV